MFNGLDAEDLGGSHLDERGRQVGQILHAIARR